MCFTLDNIFYQEYPGTVQMPASGSILPMTRPLRTSAFSNYPPLLVSTASTYEEIILCHKGRYDILKPAVAAAQNRSKISKILLKRTRRDRYR